MGAVGLEHVELPAPLRVKFPNQARILGPRFGARHVLESVAVPEPSGISKSANPALCADACAGEHEDGRATRDGQGLERGMSSNVGHGCGLLGRSNLECWFVTIRRFTIDGCCSTQESLSSGWKGQVSAR